MRRGWLLDTNVISELFKGQRASESVVRWVAQVDEGELYLSVLSLGEIAKGIALAEARGRDMSVQRDFLQRELPERFGPRILPFETDAAIVWGHLLSRLGDDRERSRILAIDAQIAATAAVASLGLCSRNVRDFRALGVTDLIDPFAVQ